MIVDAVQTRRSKFGFMMPVRVPYLGLFMSGGKLKRGSDQKMSEKFGQDEWKAWRKEHKNLHYIFFRCGVPYPAAPGDPILYESLNASLLWLIATDKVYKRDGFTIDSVSNIGNAACVHAEVFRRRTLGAPLPPLANVPTRPRLYTHASVGATTQTWEAKTPKQKLDFMNDFLHDLRDNGWCLDPAAEFALPARVILDSDNRYKRSMSKGRGDIENEREGDRERERAICVSHAMVSSCPSVPSFALLLSTAVLYLTLYFHHSSSTPVSISTPSTAGGLSSGGRDEIGGYVLNLYFRMPYPLFVFTIHNSLSVPLSVVKSYTLSSITFPSVDLVVPFIILSSPAFAPRTV